MAYVMLSICEKLEDMHITGPGQFSTKDIKCSEFALAESKRLDEEFNARQSRDEEIRKNHWKIAFLNVRSMASEDSYGNVKKDDYLMDSDLFGACEIWLHEGQTVEFDGFTGHFATKGRGKGVAAFSKIALLCQPDVMLNKKSSAIFLQTEEFDVVFMYLSQGFDKNAVKKQLLDWINQEKPTVIAGDMNWNYGKNMIMDTFFKYKLQCEQLIQKATHHEGKILDHLYVNRAMSEVIKTSNSSQDAHAMTSAYYTDHDIISLFVPKTDK